MLTELHTPVQEPDFIHTLAWYQYEDEYTLLKEHNPYFNQFDGLLMDLSIGAGLLGDQWYHIWDTPSRDILQLLNCNEMDYSRFYGISDFKEIDELRQQQKNNLLAMPKEECRNDFVTAFDWACQFLEVQMAYCSLVMLLNNLAERHPGGVTV